MNRKNLLGNTIRGLSESKGIPLGKTREGADWCLKALAPAEDVPLIGKPDGCAVPTAVMSYSATFDIPPMSNPTPWDCDILLHANPVDFMGVRRVQGGVAMYNNYWNPTLENTLLTRVAALTAFANQVESYRMIFGSATVHLNCTSLTNSGVVTAAQYLYPHTEMNYIGAGLATRHIHAFPDPIKAFAALSQLTTSYTGDARDGVYLPMKQHEVAWQSTNNYVLHINTGDSIMPNLSITCPLPASGTSVPDLPYGIRSLEQSGGLIQYAMRSCTTSVGHMSFRNLHHEASLTVTVRFGYELKVTPSSLFAPIASIPPIIDDVALEAYSSIARELKDAFPESYNSIGSLLKVLWDGARRTLPMILPKIGPVLEEVEATRKQIAPLISKRKT